LQYRHRQEFTVLNIVNVLIPFGAIEFAIEPLLFDEVYFIIHATTTTRPV